MGPGRVVVCLGLAAGLMAAGCLFFLSDWGGRGSKEERVGRLEGRIDQPASPGNESGPARPGIFRGLSERYLDDQKARAELARLGGLKMPAVARVVRLDGQGAWSRIFLGPFETEGQAASALEEAAFSAAGPRAPEEPSEEDRESGGRSGVLVELAGLLPDEDIYDELAFPYEKNVYAFARTAKVASDRALNRIYLGPFDDESQALAALGRLQDWPPARDFTIRRLESSPR